MINDILEGEEVEGIDEETANKIAQAIADNKVIKTEVISSTVEEKDISSEANIIKSALKEEKVAKYYDINIMLKVDEEEIGKVESLKTEIPITVGIPEDIPKLEENMTRKFKIISVHDEETEELETTNNGDGTITFKAKKFSVYALAYTDTKVDETNNNNNNNDNETKENEIVENNITQQEEQNQNQNQNEAGAADAITRPTTGDAIMIVVFVLLTAIAGILLTEKMKKDTNKKE